MMDFLQETFILTRNILKYTQEEMAELLGVSRVHISQLESGKIKLSRTVAIAFLAIMIFKFEQLSKDSMEYKLLSVYISDYRMILSNLINLEF